MQLSRTTRVLLRIGTGITLAFMYVPLAVIALYAFNSRRTLKWPIPGLTLEWFDKAFHNPGVRDALLTSLKAATGATLIALLLGTLAAFAVSRHRFFGRETISFLVILPLALPGIVTGMALNATFREVLTPLGIGLGLFTVIVGHATFCIVVIYNNVIARLRRTSGSFEEASADLGANTWTDVPAGHVPGAALGDGGGRAARVRAVVRRGDRHDVHGRPAADAAALDPHEPVAAEPVADRQRRRRDRDPAVGVPRLPRAPADDVAARVRIAYGLGSVKVREAMTENVLTMTPGRSLRDAARFMAERNVGAVVIIDPEEPGPGIITERDLVRSLGAGEDPDQEMVKDHLTARATFADGDWGLEEAADAMARGGFRHLVVVHDGEVEGIISMRDIIHVWRPR